MFGPVIQTLYLTCRCLISEMSVVIVTCLLSSPKIAKYVLQALRHRKVAT